MEVDIQSKDDDLGRLLDKSKSVNYLLNEPPKDMEAEKSKSSEIITRNSSSCHVPNASRYLLNMKEQSNQFFNVYQNRLKQLRPAVVERIKDYQQSEAAHFPIEERILEARPGVKCFLVGTLFKEMPLKPNVLKEYTKEQAILLVPEHQNFTSDKDTLVLEDEGGRIRLEFADTSLISSHVTGLVVGILGVQGENGSFAASQILSPGFPSQTPLPQKPHLSSAPQFVAFVSDMNVGTPTFNPLYSKLLVEFLTGHLCSDSEQQSIVSKIARTIFVGNTYCIEDEVPGQEKLRDHTRSFNAMDQARLKQVIDEVDTLMLDLSANMIVHIMPGPHDPSNYSIPQQPLNKCLLPKSSQLTSLTRATNPYHCVVDGIEFLGHSGQPISNLLNYVSLPDDSDVLDALELTLDWRILAPTAPDTLAAFPFRVHDPFIIDSCPHIYFIGNQPEFLSRKVVKPSGQVVLLLGLPSFSQTRSIVLLDLHTLSCHSVVLNTWDE